MCTDWLCLCSQFWGALGTVLCFVPSWPALNCCSVRASCLLGRLPGLEKFLLMHVLILLGQLVIMQTAQGREFWCCLLEKPSLQRRCWALTPVGQVCIRVLSVPWTAQCWCSSAAAHTESDMHSCWLGDFHGESFLSFSLLSMEKAQNKTGLAIICKWLGNGWSTFSSCAQWSWRPVASVRVGRGFHF